MYQPIMSEENVRRLYFLKIEKKKPMTKLLDQILNQYFEQQNNQNSISENDETQKAGERKWMGKKSAEVPPKSNGSEKSGIITTSERATFPSAEPGAAP